MASLKEVIVKYSGNEVPNEQITLFEETLKADVTDGIAQTILQTVENNEVKNPEDFGDLLKMIDEYQTNKVLTEDSLEYSYTPPTELLEEFGIPTGNTLSGRLIRQTKEGSFIEIDDNMDDVGPVSQNGEPIQGHPEYQEPVEEDFEQDLLKISEESSEQEIQQEQPQQVVYTKPSLEIVKVYLPSIGSIEYEVVDFIKTRYSSTLIFDPSIARPPFYPQVGLNFEIEFKGDILKVMYVGTCFDYNNLKFMCFTVLD